MGQYRPGTRAEVIIYRDGGLLTQTVELGSSPTNAVSAVIREPVRANQNPLGFQVAELSEETRQVIGTSGVRITSLEEGPGRSAGLIEGDVIVALNRKDIPSTEAFSQISQSLPDSGFVPIRIIREGQGTTMALELSP